MTQPIIDSSSARAWATHGRLVRLGAAVGGVTLAFVACRAEERPAHERPDASTSDAATDLGELEASESDSDAPHEATTPDEMVLLPEGYRIDATEVTRAQYGEWLASNPPTSGQPTYCEWNTTFAPGDECMAFDPVCRQGCDKHPQVCVDWCDAHAYCEARGKRLCGRIGGGAIAWHDLNDAAANQWDNSCTSHGQHALPYGDSPAGGTCNTSERKTGTTVPVGSIASCQPSGTYSGVLDLSGNVGEFVDSCEKNEGFLDNCVVRGGAFVDSEWDSRCLALVVGARYSVSPTTGFRCCSD